MPTTLKAFAAENRAALRRLEGHGGFFPALRACGASLDLRVRAAIALRGRRAEDGNPFGFARLAAFGFVLKLLVVEKQLFSGRKNEIGSAVDALEYLVLEFH